MTIVNIIIVVAVVVMMMMMMKMMLMMMMIIIIIIIVIMRSLLLLSLQQNQQYVFHMQSQTRTCTNFPISEISCFAGATIGSFSVLTVCVDVTHRGRCIALVGIYNSLKTSTVNISRSIATV